MTPFDDNMVKPKLPEWLNFGVDNSQQPAPSQNGGFIEMLKKRLSHPQMKDGQAGMAMGKAAVGGSAAGGGSPSSL